MPIEPVKIPQNVYIEDRIIGPVTLRQLIILLASGGLSYVIWTGAKNQLGYSSVVLTIICWIPFVIGAAFAFVRIQQISLLRFILLMIENLNKPLNRQWAPRRGISINFQYFSAAAEAAERAKKAAAPHPHREKLEELSAVLDLGPLTSAQREAASILRGEEQSAPQRPVDPRRVSASMQEGSSPLEDILERTDPPSPPARDAPSPASVMHDILPPTSAHAS